MLYIRADASTYTYTRTRAQWKCTSILTYVYMYIKKWNIFVQLFPLLVEYNELGKLLILQK